ncbi:MAG TPA: radical SAM protein [Thermoanaerobaculia bacterium]|jgi:MoaA/NifB/PqqE/SkfB family radical SAM enzyme
MSDPFVRLKQKALAAAQPLNVQLELTYRCNWRCVFCYNPRHFDRAALCGDEWIAVLGELRALGTLNVVLTGGEPLAHPEFFRIAAAAREQAFALRIFTNATLVDDAAADTIAALRVLAVEVSIHGATAEVHEAATARRGSFEAMLAGVARLRARQVPVVLKMPLTRLNETQFDDVVALAAARELPLQIDPHLTPRDDGDLSPLTYAPSREAVRRALLIGGVEPMERVSGGANCGLGRITLAIDPEGNVFPCMQWRHRALGNVRERPLRELWHTSEVRAEAAAMSTAVNDHFVATGGPLAQFPYCPALAMQETGDPLLPDAGFVARATLAAELRG